MRLYLRQNMKYDEWNIRDARPKAAALLEQAGLSPLPALVLAARGYDTPERARSFLRSGEELLHDPFLLRDMDRASARLTRALERGERICVYGDYDVDGITSTCLLTTFLSRAGGDVLPYVPNRLTEGYSLNREAIAALHARGVTLIVTVDCGITNVEEVDFAASLGIDVVITDHHECKEMLPDAAAVVNPHRPDCSYPFQMLAGVGVALKLMLALTPQDRRSAALAEYCDLAAIGTVADVMELTGENRAIVALGLRRLARGPRPGLAALLQEAGQSGKPLTASTISFSLAPRINAAGRMGCPELAVQLLLTQDAAEAALLARQLCALNRDRQEVELETFEQCRDYLDRHPEAARGAIVLAGEHWHQGVVGIVASRLAERYRVPAFMICLEHGHGKGSCRSYGHFNLFEALEQCADLLENFGGHELAAGFSIAPDRIGAFRERMSALAGAWRSEHPAASSLTVDVLLEDARLITWKNAQALSLLEPHGTGNPTPVFALTGATVTGFTRVGGGRHTRLRLRKNGMQLEGILFSATPREAQLVVGARIDAAFQLQLNDFRGAHTAQLLLCDLRPSRPADSRQLYRRYRAGAPLTAEELGRLTPQRCDFVALWRYLARSAGNGTLCESPARFSREFARACGQQEEFGRTMICLEVFCERGLIGLERGADTLTITIQTDGRKVDLEASEVLRRLRGRGGSDGPPDEGG